MRRAGIAVVKSVLFRGVQQEFTNVYFYQNGTAITIPGETLADDVVAGERQMHGSDVQFKFVRVWRADADRINNVMVFEEALSGTGGQTNNTNQDRERAVLVRWPAGVDTLGRPVYLRKYYHSCGSFAGVPFGSTVLQQTAQIPSGDRATIATKADEQRSVGLVDALWDLCSPTGRINQGPAQCHPYLEHHQLGDAWR